MNLYNLSDKIVFKILQDIDSGYLEIKNFHGELIKFGNPEHSLKAYLKIKKPNFTFNLIKGGSGADISPLKDDGVTLVGYRPDSQRYFDYHHTSRDTFDKVNKRELELGSASMTSIIYLMDKYLYNNTPVKP